MIYNSKLISIDHLKASDALKLNKLLASNTDRFIRYLPKTLEANSTFESTQNYIAQKLNQAQNKSEFLFALKDTYGIELIGLIILKNIDWNLKQGEFAYCIGKQYKGKGWMTEAIKATSKFAKEELNLKTLVIIANKSNLASVNVALNAGFTWKETLKNEFTPSNGSPVDMELYELSYER